MKQTSANRVKHFVDEFIRSEYVHDWQADRDSDFINFPNRAERCYDAAKYGRDGKTHAEVIHDWRDMFAGYLTEMRYREHHYPLFESAVYAHFDAVEAYHLSTGSLYQQIG